MGGSGSSNREVVRSHVFRQAGWGRPQKHKPSVGGQTPGITGGDNLAGEIRAGGAKQADRVRGDRRRSLYSGNPDRRSADRLRRLPAAIISSEGPYGRRFSPYPVPDSGPCSGAKLCDDHFRW
jgi:hypothetical protein